jgi:hypothetical protein
VGAMQNLQLDWHQGAAATAGLLLARVAATRLGSDRARRGVPYLGEAAIIAALYSLWQFAAQLSVLGGEGALQRGQWILRFQRRWWLPSERSTQRLIGGHPLVEQVCNLYYASMHFGVLGVFLLWLFVRHRDRYPFVRNVLVVLTAVSLVIQLVPVAPPRLLPGAGFVDTAARYGQSVYDLRVVTVDQFAAMPSVHVGWALLVGWAVLTVGRGRWRWAVLAHPVITMFVVVATANHFWLDGIVAVLLLAASIGLVGGSPRLLPRPARGRSAHAPSSAATAPAGSAHRLDDGDPRVAAGVE